MVEKRRVVSLKKVNASINETMKALATLVDIKKDILSGTKAGGVPECLALELKSGMHKLFINKGMLRR